MDALEFTTQIEQGVIHLPKEYNQYDNTTARVIVLFDKPQSYKTQKEKLSMAFQTMKGKDMFQKIENPRTWQKQLRDEWE
jgi:hypothetical protein